MNRKYNDHVFYPIAVYTVNFFKNIDIKNSDNVPGKIKDMLFKFDTDYPGKYQEYGIDYISKQYIITDKMMENLTDDIQKNKVSEISVEYMCNLFDLSRPDMKEEIVRHTYYICKNFSVKNWPKGWNKKVVSLQLALYSKHEIKQTMLDYIRLLEQSKSNIVTACCVKTCLLIL